MSGADIGKYAAGWLDDPTQLFHFIRSADANFKHGDLMLLP